MTKTDDGLNERVAQTRVPWVEVLLLVIGCIAAMVWKATDNNSYFLGVLGTVFVYGAFKLWKMRRLARMSREEKLARIKYYEQRYGA